MKKVTPHGRAVQLCVVQLPQVFVLTLLQALALLVTVSPLILYGVGFRFFLSEPYALMAAFLCCLPLYYLCVMPLRMASRDFLMRHLQGRPAPFALRYGLRLKKGLVRALRALPFTLPLLLFIGGFFYYWYMTNAVAFLRLIRSSGQLVGGGFIEGSAVLGLLGIVCACLYLIGRKRFVALEYMSPDMLKQPDALKTARTAVKQSTRLMRLVTCKNFLISLPALLLTAGFAALDMLPRLRFQFSKDLFTILETITRCSFTPHALMAMFFSMTLLYEPFAMLRKAALGAAIYEKSPIFQTEGDKQDEA